MRHTIESILSYLVILSALQYGVLVSIALDFNFSPEHMAAPGMVIVFITACSLNLIKLRDKAASRSIYAISAFTNVLCSGYALALSIQDPHIGKVITTILMAVITLSSIFSWSVFAHQINRVMDEENCPSATP